MRIALEYAQGSGAQIVEAYPSDRQAPKLGGQKLSDPIDHAVFLR